MAYCLTSKCAKNLCKWTVLVQLIIENVVTCFLEHSVAACFVPCDTQCLSYDDCLACSRMPAQTHFHNDLSCVEWNIKFCSLSHSLTSGMCTVNVRRIAQ